MKKFVAVALLLTAGIAHAEPPSRMASTASPMTPRDDCFQNLRGHVDLSAQKRGYNVLKMLEGYGATIENGDFQCMARFELGTAAGKIEQTPWQEVVVFVHGQPPAGE